MSKPIPPGTVLRSRYRVLELVGEGGGGAVYQAEDLRLTGRITAVKEIQPEEGLDPSARHDALEQFHREASTLARLDHPALPKVSDFFDDAGAYFLVMDFVAGPDLRQVVEDHRARSEFLPEKRVIEWMRQLVEVVSYLHAQEPPVIHRDIKPANVKLLDGERLKLVDFGLVKPLDPADPRTLTTARGIGSLPYTPLEQYAGDTGHTDIRSDIYSLGATLYHLATCRPPATAQERFLLPNALERPSRTNPGLSPRVENAILLALALHPDRRPATASAFYDLLTGATEPEIVHELGTAPAAWRAGLWDNAGLMALVSLLLLLAVMATWQAERSRAELEGEAPVELGGLPADATALAEPTMGTADGGSPAAATPTSGSLVPDRQ